MKLTLLAALLCLSSFAGEHQASPKGETKRRTISNDEIISEKSKKVLKEITVAATEWDFPSCWESVNSGKDKREERNKVLVSRDPKGAILGFVGKQVGGEVGSKVADNVRGMLSREIAPTQGFATAVKEGGSERGWASVKWNGDKKTWTGRSFAYPDFMAPYTDYFQFEEDGDKQIISTYLFTFGKSNAEHFRPPVKATCGTLFRFDNKGNAVVLKIEVDDQGRRFYKVRSFCGDGMGFTLPSEYQPVKDAPKAFQALINNVKYTDKPDMP